MDRRLALRSTLVTLAAVALAGSGHAQSNAPFKIGFILPMTGQSASTGKQIEAAIKLWQAQNGTTVAGRKVEVIVKDDGAVPDVTKRIAQEMVVNDKVDVLAGFGITPCAFATAPIATQSKTPMIVTAAATSAITERRRTSCAPASRCRRRRCRSPTGPPSTASGRSSPSSPTTVPASTPRSSSRASSSSTAARSSARFARP